MISYWQNWVIDQRQKRNELFSFIFAGLEMWMPLVWIVFVLCCLNGVTCSRGLPPCIWCEGQLKWKTLWPVFAPESPRPRVPVLSWHCVLLNIFFFKTIMFGSLSAHSDISLVLANTPTHFQTLVPPHQICSRQCSGEQVNVNDFLVH